VTMTTGYAPYKPISLQQRPDLWSHDRLMLAQSKVECYTGSNR
jgi:hypothetical protein